MLWLNSSRERIKSENPGISVTEISKKAGEMWRQLGKEEKEVGLADYKEQCKTVYCQSKTPFERTETAGFHVAAEALSGVSSNFFHSYAASFTSGMGNEGRRG